MKQGKTFFISPRKLFSFLTNQILTFQILSVMTSSNTEAWNTKQILLNNWGNKHSLVMKTGQFIYYKRKIFIKKFFKNCDLEISSRSFFTLKESSVKRNLRMLACWFEYKNIILIWEFRPYCWDKNLDVFMNAFDLECLIKKPACLQSTSPSCIDLVLTNKKEFFKNS